MGVSRISQYLMVFIVLIDDQSVLNFEKLSSSLIRKDVRVGYEEPPNSSPDFQNRKN